MYDTWKSLKRIVVVVVVVVYLFVLGSQKLFIIRLGVAEAISAVTLYLLPASKRRKFLPRWICSGTILRVFSAYRSGVALTATMCLYNVSGGDELIKRKTPKNISIQPFLINTFQLHSNAARL